jgi:hypothetical protein
VVSKNYYGDEYRGAYELHVERARGIQQEYRPQATPTTASAARTR